jgi:hypothetical protein
MEHVLGEVNMKVLRLLSIVVICSAKKSNGLGVMQETMELGSATRFQNVLILMKSVQHIIHHFEAFCVVHCILSKIDKIKESLQRTGQGYPRIRSSSPTLVTRNRIFAFFCPVWTLRST